MSPISFAPKDDTPAGKRKPTTKATPKSPTVSNETTGKSTVITRDVALEDIKLDQRAQPRDHLNTEKTGEYAEAMALGDKFPPLVVFHDASGYWLADGFHRHYAAQGAKLKSFPCEVHAGGLRDAILYAMGANATHGYARTDADKRRAIRTLLEDAEWSTWSARAIARHCRVDDKTVAKVKAEITPSVTAEIRSEPDQVTYQTKHGTTATMKTAGINAGREKATVRSERKVENTTSEPIISNASEPENDVESTAPVTDAPSPERQAEIDRMHANAYISDAIRHIEKAFASLPAPMVAASDFPDWHIHSFSAAKARAIRDWFDAFATEFEKIEETADVDIA